MGQPGQLQIGYYDGQQVLVSAVWEYGRAAEEAVGGVVEVSELSVEVSWIEGPTGWHWGVKRGKLYTRSS